MSDPTRTHQVQADTDGALRRRTRIRAATAALAAGGLASLSVVLIGPPAVAQASAATVAVQVSQSGVEPVRRPDVTLGAGR